MKVEIIAIGDELTSGRILNTTSGYAARHGDTTFDLRLALGLDRSLITSTRFELSERFAKLMLHRGVFLLERIAAHAGDPAGFTLPLASVCE